METESLAELIQGIVIKALDGRNIELVRTDGACIVRPVDDFMEIIAVLNHDDSPAEMREATLLAACAIFGHGDASTSELTEFGLPADRQCWPCCAAADFNLLLTEMKRLAGAESPSNPETGRAP